MLVSAKWDHFFCDFERRCSNSSQEYRNYYYRLEISEIEISILNTINTVLYYSNKINCFKVVYKDETLDKKKLS